MQSSGRHSTVGLRLSVSNIDPVYSEEVRGFVAMHICPSIIKLAEQKQLVYCESEMATTSASNSLSRPSPTRAE